MKKINLTLFSIFLLISICTKAQVIDTLAIQDFETSPATPTLTYTVLAGSATYHTGNSGASNAPANSPLGVDGSRAWGVTTSAASTQFEFANVTIPPGYDSVRIRVRIAAMNLVSIGGGPDALDTIGIQISTNGGSNYYNKLKITGPSGDNGHWPYSATGIAKTTYLPPAVLFMNTGTGLQAQGYSTAEISLPGTETQIRVKIAIRSSSGTDTWLVDNVAVIGEKPVILPVTLKQFTGVRSSSEKVNLAWTVASQMNIKQYEIEYAENGVTFNKVATVDPIASSVNDLQYNYEINNNKSLSYYRIKMIDKDGKFTYSPVITIKGNTADKLMTVFPNPAKNNLQINYSGSSSKIKIIVTDASGKKVLVQEGVLINKLNISKLKPGQYFIKLTDNDKILYSKFIKE
ncbi:MAG: T9SS type A sorting domain-containing protein [Bacteroidota bacterium]